MPKKNRNTSTSGFTSQQMQELHRLIKKDIRLEPELKCFHTSSAGTNFDKDITDTTDAGFLLVGLANGTGDYQRIGDSIRLKRIHIKAAVSLPFNTGVYSAHITCLVLSCKSAPQATSTTMPWTSLLDNDGTTNGWTGTVLNRLQPICLENFNLHARKDIPLGFYYSTVATQAFMNTGGGVGSLPFMDFELDLPFDKVVKYDPGLTTPSSFNPFIVFAITDGDASITTVYAATTGYMTLWSSAYFTDV